MKEIAASTATTNNSNDLHMVSESYMPTTVLSTVQTSNLFSQQPDKLDSTKLCLFTNEKESL